MRVFYTGEGALDLLMHIAKGPVYDGDLISKSMRDRFVRLGWIKQCEGWNIISLAGREVIAALDLCSPYTPDRVHPADAGNSDAR